MDTIKEANDFVAPIQQEVKTFKGKRKNTEDNVKQYQPVKAKQGDHHKENVNSMEIVDSHSDKLVQNIPEKQTKLVLQLDERRNMIPVVKGRVVQQHSLMQKSQNAVEILAIKGNILMAAQFLLLVLNPNSCTL